MSDVLIRGAVFVTIVATLFAAERLRRWHAVPPDRARIGIANVALGAMGAVGVRLLLPWAGVAAAVTADTKGIGLAYLFDWPLWLAAVVGFLGLDLAIYAQHRASHAVPLLWRLHRVHHTETHLDFTSALRFHPVEIVLSAGWRWLVILALGAPAVAVLVFETVLNGTALFNHSNLQLPAWLDRASQAGCGDAGHAPRASLHRACRAAAQLRLQSAVVGLAVRQLLGTVRARIGSAKNRRR